jgi:DNA-binding LacI/PurR family transcriptional regulator
MKVSMAEIAKKAGLSKSMVSRALRNYKEISEETRKKVLTIALEMGYSQDDNLSDLGQRLSNARRRQGHTIRYNTLNLVFYGSTKEQIVTSNYFRRLSILLYAAFEKAGFSILESYPQTQEQYFKVLESTQTDGALILSNVQGIEESMVPRLKLYSRTKPLIFVSSFLYDHDDEFNSVRADNVHAGQTAAKYLVKKGIISSFLILLRAMRL